MDNLGVIIHWGVYSVPGYDDIKSAKRRKIKNGSEWYYQRLLTKETDYRKTSGWKETQEYHNENYPGKEYYELAQDFTAGSWDPDKWVSYFKDKHVGYIIITAKHHDGYCLWDNKRRNKAGKKWNSVEVGPKKNIIELLSIATRKAGLKFGVYYSLYEFEYPTATIKYINDIVHPDISDLIEKYKPDVWWFDGSWIKTYKQWNLEPLLKKIHKYGGIYNDRLGKDTVGTMGDVYNYSDRFIPEKKINHDWESIQTIGYSWGYNRDQEKEDFKSGAELYEIYEKVTEFDGKLLINFGPNRHGIFDRNEKKSFTDFYKLL